MQNVKEVFVSNVIPLKGLLIIIVGLLVLGWLLNTPAGLMGKADAIGYAVCHRIDIRSFHINHRPLPLCARCSGMYLGAVLGLSYQFLLSSRKAGTPPWRVMLVLSIFTIGFIIDGINSFLSLIPLAPTLYTPQNWLRLATGTGLGLVMAVAIFPAFNQTLLRDWKREPAIPGIISLGGLVLLSVTMNLVLLTENPYILYPSALISAAGVLVILTMIYTMLLLIIFKYENQFTSLNQLVIPFVGGFGLAILQIIILDVLRYSIMGTWAGFHFG
jgi:uncharacterized membrane protein